MQSVLPSLAKFFAWILLATVLLTSCKQGSSPTRNIIRPDTVLINISNSLIQIENAIEACRLIFPELTIITSFEPNAPFDIQIRYGPGKEMGSFYFLAEDELVVIQSKTIPAHEISFSQLSELYTGSAELPTGLTLWSYPEGDDLRTAFNQLVLNDVSIRGEVRLSPDIKSLADQIASANNAIGYLPRSTLPDNVRIITSPSRLAQVAVLPVLAVVTANANPASAKVITCLQSGPGQNWMADLFTFRE